jgi:hemerythrin-like metal-binding protein
MKPFLVWRDDWLLGFDRLDDQHLELVDTLNNLHQLVLHKSEVGIDVGMDAICHQLFLLRELTQRHFETEEGLMQSYGYPDLTGHHREHVMLLAELQEHIREIEAGSKAFTMGTLTALKHWQIDHLLYSDRKFANYLMCQLPSNKIVDIARQPAFK